MLKTITGNGKSALVKDLQVMRLGKLHACLLTRRSCHELVGYCERHGMGQQLDKVVN